MKYLRRFVASFNAHSALDTGHMWRRSHGKSVYSLQSAVQGFMSLRAENAVSGVTVTNCSMLCSLACKNILVRITDPVDAVVDIPRTVVVVLPCVGRHHFPEVRWAAVWRGGDKWTRWLNNTPSLQPSTGHRAMIGGCVQIMVFALCGCRGAEVPSCRAVLELRRIIAAAAVSGLLLDNTSTPGVSSSTPASQKLLKNLPMLVNIIELWIWPKLTLKT